MPPALPARVAPLRLARHGETLAGTLAIRDLPRLKALVRESDGTVEVSLRFHDGGGFGMISGVVATRLVLTCQRCLSALNWLLTVVVETRVAVSEAEEADADMECVAVDDEGELQLHAFVEDELLLAMPEFARHQPAECGVDMAEYKTPDEPLRENPFAVLSTLKRDD